MPLPPAHDVLFNLLNVKGHTKISFFRYSFETLFQVLFKYCMLVFIILKNDTVLHFTVPPLRSLVLLVSSKLKSKKLTYPLTFPVITLNLVSDSLLESNIVAAAAFTQVALESDVLVSNFTIYSFSTMEICSIISYEHLVLLYSVYCSPFVILHL